MNQNSASETMNKAPRYSILCAVKFITKVGSTLKTGKISHIMKLRPIFDLFKKAVILTSMEDA